MKKQKICFVPFYYEGVPASSPSVRIRSRWPIKYLNKTDKYEAVEYNPVMNLNRFDVVVFQKTYIRDFFRDEASKLTCLTVFDLCDPEWLTHDEATTQKLLDMFEYVDVITVPIVPLADWVSEQTKTPVVVIPDRQDMEFHDKTKRWEITPEKPRYVWYGMKGNIPNIMKFKKYLIGHELLVISDASEDDFFEESDINVLLKKWDLNTVNENIIKGDIVINPKDESNPVNRYKSNNKTTKAMALGMPVAETENELKNILKNLDKLPEIGRKNRREAETKWSMELTAKDWDKLIQNYAKK